MYIFDTLAKEMDGLDKLVWQRPFLVIRSKQFPDIAYRRISSLDLADAEAECARLNALEASKRA